MEANEIAAKRHKKRKTYCFARLLRLFAAILFSLCVANVAALSVGIGEHPLQTAGAFSTQPVGERMILAVRESIPLEAL
jgi:hypothetical protein